MSSKKNKLIILLGIIVLGMLLRTPITSVGAISGNLKQLLNINNTMVGFITTIPLIAFALFSSAVIKISHKTGLEKTILLAAIITTLGLTLRFYLNTPIFFLATFIIGLGITVGNVLLPGLTKKYFPENLGVMTGFYAVVMTISASIAAGISYPIASSNIINEKFSTALAVNIWLVVAVVNVIIYSAISKGKKVEVFENEEKVNKNLLKNLKLWAITISMGLQSALFYCSVSWFAEIMISKGFSPEIAGLLLSISQFAQFPSTFLVPIMADKLRNKMIIPVTITVGYIVALLGIIITNANFSLMAIWVIIYALAGGGSFSYVMYLFSAKSKNEKESATVSGLAQSGGYLIAAVFPPLLGYIRDISNWNIALYVLLVTAGILFVSLIYCSSKGNIIED
ncbi:transporter, major facilitator family protein [Gemella bergeri ATCC 700627]|uniref:Transporter, major facilitator family protein n=1 Tax=Gemella bergeri ATCC 700627 TaxID=1321820 RepID=U2QS61_9BACL|nr:MFS transporter [Gemella bergeri]ERK59366.1 transporter, major facilitator family protein [Gemella bergeri ATCC 700627]